VLWKIKDLDNYGGSFFSSLGIGSSSATLVSSPTVPAPSIALRVKPTAETVTTQPPSLTP
jgi:hypothetical protein